MKIAAVGAGISGMQTAGLLGVLGQDVTVFEARDSVGGRLEAVHDGDATYEGGGEWSDATNRACISLSTPSKAV